MGLLEIMSASWVPMAYYTCTRVGIHPGRVQLVSPVKLATSRMEASPGPTVLRELIRDFHPILSPSYVAENSRSGEGLQACRDRGCPHLQLALCSTAPHDETNLEGRWLKVLLGWALVPRSTPQQKIKRLGGRDKYSKLTKFIVK